MADDNADRASSRLAAETFMPMMMKAFHQGLHEVGSLSRWLLATLVVINGAAAVALLPIKMAAWAKLCGAGAFMIGILTALAAGIWALYAFKRVSVSAGTMLGYWLDVADDGRRLAALERTMKSHMDHAIGSHATDIFVLASVAAFLAGCAVTGCGLLSQGVMQ